MNRISLTTSRLKVARARELLGKLAHEFQEFFHDRPYSLKKERDEIGRHTLVYYPDKSLPQHWPIDVGSALMLLRAALDNAVHQLSTEHQGVPVKNSEFPIFSDQDAFFQLQKNGSPARGSGLFKMRGLPLETQAVIESAQPYRVNEADKISLFWLLHELTNRDKHRELLICRGLSSDTGIIGGKIPHGGYFQIDTHRSKYDERTVLAWIDAPGVDEQEIEFDADLTFEVIFDEDCSDALKGPMAVMRTSEKICVATENVLGYLENSFQLSQAEQV